MNCSTCKYFQTIDPLFGSKAFCHSNPPVAFRDAPNWFRPEVKPEDRSCRFYSNIKYEGK